MEQTFQLDCLDKSKPIFMIGIGGISMSGLAVMLRREGFSVCGSDFKESPNTKQLTESGIPVFIGHDPKNIGDVSAVVYTAAISGDNPELVYARGLGVPVVERAVLLGELMKRYGCPIAVSGTHGKTTTTSMLSQVLLAANADPTISVGGIMPAIGSNIRIGKSPYMVTEACEYSGSFLHFFPKISLILNVEEDHLDYFSDIQHIIRFFRAFAEKTPDDGLLIVNADNENTMKTVFGLKKPICTYSVTNKHADFSADNIRWDDLGCASFTVLKQGQTHLEAKLSVPGEHNVSNALSVCAAADFMGIPTEAVCRGLAEFCGTKRRFEKKGLFGGALIVDDYAHHPTEIKATLKTAKIAAGAGKVWCVFQPHTYSRSHLLRKEFAESFYDCDGLCVVDVFAAREIDTGLIHSRDIAEEINEKSHNAQYAASFEEAEKILLKNISVGDIVITMGAGDVYKIGESILCISEKD